MSQDPLLTFRRSSQKVVRSESLQMSGWRQQAPETANRDDTILRNTTQAPRVLPHACTISADDMHQQETPAFVESSARWMGGYPDMRVSHCSYSNGRFIKMFLRRTEASASKRPHASRWRRNEELLKYNRASGRRERRNMSARLGVSEKEIDMEVGLEGTMVMGNLTEGITQYCSLATRIGTEQRTLGVEGG